MAIDLRDVVRGFRVPVKVTKGKQNRGLRTLERKGRGAASKDRTHT